MMTREELTALLTGPFYRNYANDLAARIGDEKLYGWLYEAATAPRPELSSATLHKIRFRAAYTLEILFFAEPETFSPFVEAFCSTDFPACTDGSARRHFGKIMAHLLRTHKPSREASERIAETAAEWMLDPHAKVAVKVWAAEILAACRERVPWVAESWDDLLETFAADATPGIACRLRRWQKPSRRKSSSGR